MSSWAQWPSELIPSAAVFKIYAFFFNIVPTSLTRLYVSEDTDCVLLSLCFSSSSCLQDAVDGGRDDNDNGE